MIIHTVGGERLTLLQDRAIYIHDRKIMLVSDVHLGKVDHFRKYGIALPVQARKDNFERLQELLLSHAVERVIFLGDLFHSEINDDWYRFAEFISEFSHISFELVLGNHDILDSAVYDDVLHHIYADTLTLGGLLLSHAPVVHEGLYNLCGHIHPGYVLRGKGRQRLRLPCYYFGEKSGILPAFGTFTGLYMMEPKVADQIYVIANGEVLAVQ